MLNLGILKLESTKLMLEKKHEFILSEPISLNTSLWGVFTSYNTPEVFYMSLITDPYNAYFMVDELTTHVGVEFFGETEQSTAKVKKYCVYISPLYNAISVYEDLKNLFNELIKIYTLPPVSNEPITIDDFTFPPTASADDKSGLVNE